MGTVIRLVTGKPVGAAEDKAVQSSSAYACGRCDAPYFVIRADGTVTCGDCNQPMRNLWAKYIDPNSKGDKDAASR